MKMSLDTIRRLAASRIKVTQHMDINSVSHSIKYPYISPFCNGALLPHQLDHSERLLHVLKTRGVAGDTSPPGRGKTYVAAHCIKELNLPAIVFCPKSSICMWWKVLHEWGVPIISITNYDMARSSHNDDVTKWYDMRNGYTDVATICPWITKSKSKNKHTTKSVLNTKDTVNFKWNLPYKCFIIFDEEHVGKNIHTQSFSLIKGAVQARKRQGHKTLHLSATPIEKKVNLKSIMYFLELISKPDMDAVNTFFKERIGSTDMSDIHRYLYTLDPNNIQRCTCSMSSMPEADIPKNIINDIRPMTVKMTKEVTEKIAEKNKEILLLKERLREKEYDNTLGSINANRRFIESYKIDTAEELAVNALNNVLSLPEIDMDTKMHTGRDVIRQFKRVAIFVNYKSTLHELNDRLSKHKVLIDGKEKYLRGYISLLHGDQTMQESDQAREDYISGKTKVMLATIRKGGLSLSLHDEVGDKETLSIILPPTSATDLIQTSGRHYRTNVRSSVTQIIIFTLGDAIEESIRDALATKLDDIINFTTGMDSNIDLHDFASKNK